MGICDSSIAPAHWGKPWMSLKPFTTVVRLSLYGMEIYCSKSCCTVIVHTSFMTVQAVYLATPNKCPLLLYSMILARHCIVIATCHSTHLSGSSVQSIFSLVFYYNLIAEINVSRLSLKFSFHSSCENCGRTLSYQSPLLFLDQIAHSARIMC